MLQEEFLVESPSKKHTRVAAWIKALRNVDQGNNSLGPHFVMAGPEGEGNISTLLGFGVRAKSIIAVGETEEDAFAVHEKYPEVQVVCSDLVSMAKEHRRKLTTAAFTYAGNITDAYLETVAQVAHYGLRDVGLVSLTSMIDEGVSETISPNVVSASSIADQELLFAFDVLIKESSRAIPGRFDNQAEYVGFVGFKIARMLGPHRLLIHPSDAYRFKHRGKDYLTTLFKTRRLNKDMPERKFWLKHYDFVKKWDFAHHDYADMDEAGLLSAIQTLREDNGWKRERVPAIYNVTEEDIERLEKHYGQILKERRERRELREQQEGHDQ